MEEKQVTINEFAVKMINELRRVGYSKESIYREINPRIKMVVKYYTNSGITYYSVKASDELLRLHEECYQRNEISNTY